MKRWKWGRLWRVSAPPLPVTVLLLGAAFLAALYGIVMPVSQGILRGALP